MSNRRIILYLLLLAAICITAYTLIVVIPARAVEQAYNGAKKIGSDIRDAFQMTPEITINNTIVLQQQVEIFEVATVSQQFRHEYDWTNSLLGSTKRIHIEGTFEAKAGFDLHREFKIDIRDELAIVTLPSPKLLSLTPQPDITFTDENGFWNWINAEDRAKAINAFNLDATKYAGEADFVNQARKNMEGKLTEILNAHGKQVVIQYKDSPVIGKD
jgi:hypothetical protein